MTIQQVVELRKRAMLHALDRAGIRYQIKHHEILLFCPVCGPAHTRPTLYVNYVRQVGWCHRCPQSFLWTHLVTMFRLQYHHPTESAPTVQELRSSLRAVLGAPLRQKRSPSDLSQYPEVPFPLGTVPAWKSSAAIRWCASRKLSIEHLLDYSIMWCPYGPMRHRVLFPVVWNKRCLGWTARSIHSDSPAKYLHSHRLPKTHLLYPQENLETYARIILVEGVIPALLFRGVASFGKWLSLEQLQLIRNADHVKQVVVVYDRDAWKTEREGRDPPAYRAWKLLAKTKTAVGLILPKALPQPDHFHVSVVANAIEKAAGKSTDSSIWLLSESGTLTRQV